MTITARDFSEIRWRGHWIWVPEEPISPGAAFPGGPRPRAREAHGLFRRVVMLEKVPERAPARLTADSRYALWVNGREVSRGPIRGQPRRLSYDLFDLAPYLRAGENVLAVYVKYYGAANAYWQPAAPNMTLGKTGVLVFEADLGPAGWLISDSTWKARKSDAWEPLALEHADQPISGGIPHEIFDARRLAPDWQSLAFDDRDWGQAQCVPAMHIGGFARTQPPTDPYGPLHPRPIGALGGETARPVRIRAEVLAGQVASAGPDPVRRVEATLGLPVRATLEADALPLRCELASDVVVRVIVDLGRIVSGLVTFSLDAPPGAVLDLSYVENPITGPGRFLGQHAGTRYIARGAHDSHEVFDSNGFRYAYLVVHETSGPVTLTDFAVRERLYPWEGEASFECSDAELNRLYAAGVRTVQLNSHDAFIDCPTREQRTWVGDAVVHQMVHLATNTDWRLAWHYLTLGDSPRADGILPMSVAGEIEVEGGHTIPDWALHWVHGVYNRYRFGGERDAVKALMPGIEKVLRWYLPYQTATGVLKDVVEWNLVDWSSVLVEDTSALLTALWARGLREFAEMAGWLEENASRRWADALYDKARAGFEVFWDARRGAYVDHLVDGRQRPEMSQLAGALAIVSGVAPRERWGPIVDVITDPARLVVRSWTGASGDYSEEKMARQFQGIYETDWDAEREIVIAEPFMSYVVHDAVALAGRADRLPDLCRRWSEFLIDGFDTFGECWGWGTRAHGWSATPTRDLIFYTLGVTPAEPGYTRARIAPRLGGLPWARGAVPTPHGLITVSVSADGVAINSPVPVRVDLLGRPSVSLPAGAHTINNP